MKTPSKTLFALLLSSWALVASAQSLSTTLFNTADHGESIGQVNFTDTAQGLLIEPQLSGLNPGEHGFHIHTHPDCSQHGHAAGGHLDPYHTGKHLGPYNLNGHLGDLPVLLVDGNGNATQPMIAPRLTVKDILHHSIMVHEHGDNGRDAPKPLGGGGARMACGVID